MWLPLDEGLDLISKKMEEEKEAHLYELLNKIPDIIETSLEKSEQKPKKKKKKN